MENLYEKQWGLLKRLHRRGITLFIAIAPTLLSAALLGNTIHVCFTFIGMIAVLVEGVFFAITISQIRTFPCPRCNKPFTVLFAFGPNTLGRKCVHCGLKLNEHP
jgi:hypothetical protein